MSATFKDLKQQYPMGWGLVAHAQKLMTSDSQPQDYTSKSDTLLQPGLVLSRVQLRLLAGRVLGGGINTGTKCELNTQGASYSSEKNAYFCDVF